MGLPLCVNLVSHRVGRCGFLIASGLSTTPLAEVLFCSNTWKVFANDLERLGNRTYRDGSR